MKYLTAQQKIQQIDKLASNLYKVNLVSLASVDTAQNLEDLDTAISNLLSELLEKTDFSKSFDKKDMSSLSNVYLQQVKKLYQVLSANNLKSLLPSIIEILSYFRNSLLDSSSIQKVESVLSQLQSAQQKVKNLKDTSTDIYSDEYVPVLSQVQSVLEDPMSSDSMSSNLVKDLQKQLAKLDPNNAMFSPVKPTGILDNNTTKAIQKVLDTLKTTRNITPAVNLNDPATFPKLTNLLAVYDEQGVKLY